MSKKVTISARPKQSAGIDKWVETRQTVVPQKLSVKPKRLTIDIDPGLHRRLKMSCVSRDIQIADLLRSLIMHELYSQNQPLSDR